MSLSRIEIRGNSGKANDIEVLVNGKPLPGLCGVALTFDVGCANTATLKINVGSVDIDAQALVELIARATEKGIRAGATP